ncbi:hydroxyisourate hydrolase [Streptomyces sp. NPDC051776]|uniref:hydroxyisourate hydrolase n=1 Tax=Streptomyces sp. NPDC051776 TaxID=3155414 RepID=UPI003440D361
MTDTVTVSTHILDTSIGRPARGIAVELAVRTAAHAEWTVHGASATDADGRCKDLPALPADTAHARLRFGTGPYFTHQHHASGRQGQQGQQAEEQQDAPRTRDSGAFFPEVAIVFAVEPGEHYHVPLLLNPFGYSVYRGS